MAVILVNLTDTFEQWRKKTNAISLALGDLDQLLSEETTVIRAVNENFTHIGVMTVLTTDIKSNLVDAVNEVDLHTDINTINIGSMIALTTTNKSTLVNAINELDADIGDRSSLTTGAIANLVSAINEVDLHTDQITAFVGPAASLTTDEDGTIVGAINEVDLHTDTNTTNIGDMALDTPSTTNLTDAVNDAYNKALEVGDLTTLSTDAKTSAVSAINEVDAHTDTNTSSIGTLSSLKTSDKTSLVNAINEALDLAIAFSIALG